ncbi:MAG: hypothetical protein EBY33_00865 [Proteobacteria bacterium]|nr:hypothetical protein [Pseudomonadota bacterium]
MGAKGWTMPTVPKEYGGGGLNAEQVTILNQVCYRIIYSTKIYINICKI